MRFAFFALLTALAFGFAVEVVAAEKSALPDLDVTHIVRIVLVEGKP